MRYRLVLPKQAWEEKYGEFTVAELGEIPPKWASSWCDVEEYVEEGVTYGRTYVCGREHEMRARGELFFVDLTEADARAKMLIYLLENRLLVLREAAA